MLNFPGLGKAMVSFSLVFMLMLIPAVLGQQQQCTSFITGQALNGSGDPIDGSDLSANVRNQYGDHAGWSDSSFSANASGYFNVSDLCYGKVYSIMFQDESNDPNRAINWSVVQALGQDIGNLNISQVFANINGYMWTNETSKADITSGFVEFYNLGNELIWIGGVCGTQDSCQNNTNRYNEYLPPGEYYARAVTHDYNNWGNMNVSDGLTSINISAGTNPPVNFTANLTATMIEIGSLALDGNEKAGVWMNVTNKNSGDVFKKRTVNQTWGDVMTQFILQKDITFNTSIYDPDGVYPVKDSSVSYNTTATGRISFSLWNSSLAPSSNSSVRGIVIDSTGTALENATVEAIIMRLLEPSHQEADPEGWIHREWKGAVINSTLTDSNGNFELILPSPSGDFVRYAIISYWDNSTTAGADYVKEFDRNGWRGYDFSGGRQINNSIIELQPGATIKMNIYQPGGSVRINSTWIQSTYQNMGDRLWRVFSLKADRKPWGYEWNEFEAAETQGGNFEDKSIFSINSPVGRNILVSGMEISRGYFEQNPGANSSYACITNYTLPASYQGRIVEVNCNMEVYRKMSADVGQMDGEFIVLSPDDGLPLFPVHPRGSGTYSILLKNTSLYNLTFNPWGPRVYSEIYNLNVTDTPTLNLQLSESKYHMDVEIPESMEPSIEYTLRAFPFSQGGMPAGLNMSYDIYYGNESFYMTGNTFQYQNVSMGAKSKEFYNTTINISEPGSYMITVKAGIYNETTDIYTYTRDERDAEVWNLNLDIWSDKWTFMRGDDVLLSLRAFNITSGQPVYNAEYTVTIYDFERRKEYTVVSSTALTNNDKTKVSFTIPQYLQEGWYRTTVTVANASEGFRGKRNLHFHLTSMNFGVRFEKFEIAPDEDQKVYIVARDRDGLPVEGMNVTIEDVMTRYTASGDTDSNGMLTLTIPSDSYGNMWGYHEVEITAFSPDGKKEKTFDGFVVMPVKLFIEPNGKTKFVPGENLTWEVGLVSLQDGLKVPPDEVCLPLVDGICTHPETAGMPQMVVGKGDLIPGPPVDIRIYYPNGSLYYEETLEFDQNMNLENPLHDLTHILAGSVPGTYGVDATLDREMTTYMSFRVRTVELKADTEKAQYGWSDLEGDIEELIASVEAINYSSGQPDPIAGSTVTAKVYDPSGMNITGNIQNTTDSSGRTTFNLSTVNWTAQEGGVFRTVLNFTDTGDERELYSRVNVMAAGLNLSDTSLELGDTFTVNTTFINESSQNLWVADGLSDLDEVTVSLTLPDGMEYQYQGQLEGNTYSAQINISPDFPSGSYTLRVRGELVDGTRSWIGINDTTFNVGGYELEAFLNKEGKPEYILNEEVEVISRLTYSNGTPIAGATLLYELFDERKHTFMGTATSSATDSDGMASVTFGPQTADVPVSKDGVYAVKVKYKPGSNVQAKEVISFLVASITTSVTSDKEEYTSGDDLLINLTVSKSGARVYNGTPMAMIIPPDGPPVPVETFSEIQLAASTVYSANVSGLLSESGMYFILAGVDDINGSFGGDEKEIFVQDFNLTFVTENMTYSEGDNVTIIMNASNATNYMNGSIVVELMKRGAGLVNTTTGQLDGNGTVTFMNKSPGSYMAKISMTANNGDKAVSSSKFGVKSFIVYTLTTKDASNNSRGYFTTSEQVTVLIGPSLPPISSLILIAPDGSKGSMPADSLSLAIAAAQKSSAGWYLLRLESNTGIVFATGMFQVKA
jgi:hypothetical protein